MDPRAREVLRVASAIPDRALASGYLRSVLRELSLEDAADLVSVVHAASVARDPTAAEAWLLIAIVLAEDSEEDLARGLAHMLRRRGNVELADAMASDDGREIEEDASTVPDFGKGRPLSLGERKSVARTRDRHLLARVLRDPHPDVIRILLGNPYLTEPDVIRVAARRPVRPEVLREICRSPRWMVRYRVRLALIKNPYLPLPLALRLVPQLTAPDQRDIAGSPELDARLREACATALSPRTLH
ncbi:MAG: hypothetical protein OHK0013_16540 [Sandaracinaceae bacterium]